MEWWNVGRVEYWVSGLTKPFYENGRIPLNPSLLPCETFLLLFHRGQFSIIPIMSKANQVPCWQLACR
jgi:hypothetical protein